MEKSYDSISMGDAAKKLLFYNSACQNEVLEIASKVGHSQLCSYSAISHILLVKRGWNFASERFTFPTRAAPSALGTTSCVETERIVKQLTFYAKQLEAIV